MGRMKDIEFKEGEFLVKTLREKELADSYRLRHRVFAESLHWVPAASDGREIDLYDLWGTTIGLINGRGNLLGMARLLPSSGPFMMEKEFRALLPSDYIVRKESDTAEITRLAIDPEVRDSRIAARILLGVLKGIYQWAVENDIRYYYLEVEKRFLRSLRILGFPCEPLGCPVLLPPAGAESVAALYDMVKFDEHNAHRRPDFLAWMSTVETCTGEVLTGRTSAYSEVGGVAA